MLINDFYANREVFITGGTGFLGKALIEKLLRDSPKIKVLYILLRAKKSLSITERLEQFKKDKAFDHLHQTCPEVFQKLHAIQGDSEQLGLAIQPSDLKLMQNVSIIFHMAANVKFDDPLRSSILLNTRGTFELLKIAQTFKNLVAFLHCSTAYCNPFEKVVEEKVYEMPVEWRKAIKIAETYDEDTLNALFYKYTGHYPNTYTFTKNLSEQLIKEFSSKLPISLFRPSVVINAYKEPIAGWTDNLNGPFGLMVALNVGILPIAFCNPATVLDVVPIDLVTKLTIVAAYKRGMQFIRKESIPNGLDVVNCASGGIYHLNFSGADALYEEESRKNPMENKIWNYDPPTLTGCYYYYLLQLFTMAIPLGIVLDTILRFMGHKPKMVSMVRRIAYATKALLFFSVTSFTMVNQNMINLENVIPESDIAKYGVKNDFNMDIMKYLVDVVKGIKYFLFNQPMQATEAALRRAKILFIVNRSIKVFIAILLARYLWSTIVKLS